VNPHVLLVDDDKILASLTREYLTEKGLIVFLEHDADAGLRSFKENKIDICILDVSMPFKDGFKLARDIKNYNESASVIFLTAKKEKEDRIQGLLMGADDYITKPFSMKELYLRIMNIYKRLSSSALSDTVEFKIGAYKYNTVSRKLVCGDTTERLSEMEGQLLQMFLTQSNMKLTRELALKEIWHDENLVKSRSLSVYINKLRHRLAQDPNIEIINLYGTGYQLVVE